MNISETWLLEQKACPESVEWFTAQTETDGLAVVKKLTAEKKLEWANWIIVQLMAYRQYVSYAVYAAEQVIDLYEKKHPDDTQPRNTIKTARKCIENPSEENKIAANAACCATSWFASWAASAANAASEAAGNAAGNAASWAASAAGNTNHKTLAKILKYGIGLLEND